MIGFAGLAFISVWLTRDATALRNENIKRCGRLMALAIGLILPALIFFTSLMVKFALADDSIEYF